MGKLEMNDAVAWNPTKTERLIIKMRQAKGDFYMFLHKITWRFLWFTKLAVPYSKWACRNNLYKKFTDGRCHWCGNVHGVLK